MTMDRVSFKSSMDDSVWITSGLTLDNLDHVWTDLGQEAGSRNGGHGDRLNRIMRDHGQTYNITDRILVMSTLTMDCLDCVQIDYGQNMDHVTNPNINQTLNTHTLLKCRRFFPEKKKKRKKKKKKKKQIL